jgi:hypothetical protein
MRDRFFTWLPFAMVLVIGALVFWYGAGPGAWFGP